jgi:hypothetical protein
MTMETKMPSRKPVLDIHVTLSGRVDVSDDARPDVLDVKDAAETTVIEQVEEFATLNGFEMRISISDRDGDVPGSEGRWTTPPFEGDTLPFGVSSGGQEAPTSKSILEVYPQVCIDFDGDLDRLSRRYYGETSSAIRRLRRQRNFLAVVPGTDVRIVVNLSGIAIVQDMTHLVEDVSLPQRVPPDFDIHFDIDQEPANDHRDDSTRSSPPDGAVPRDHQENDRRPGGIR